MNKLKICIIAPSKLPIPAVKGGAVEGLINLLIDENEIEKKMDVTVFSVYDKQAKCDSKKYKHTRFIYIHFNYFFEKVFYKLKEIFYKLFNRKINVHLYTLLCYSLIIFKDYDFIIIESADPELSIISKKYCLSKTIGHIHGRMSGTELMSNKFGYFIGISDFIKNSFLEDSSVDEKRLYVLKNGIDISKFDVEITKTIARQKIGVNDNRKIILYVGRIIKEKGVLELIKAFNCISTGAEQLILIGSANFGRNEITEFEKEFEGLIRDNSNITHLGYLDNSMLIHYYKAADVVVMPSIWEEPAGLVALEALACKSPLITTKSGGLPEYVCNDSAIILDIDDNLVCNLGQSIQFILSDSLLASKLVSNGYRTVKNYSQKNYYLGYYNILHDIYTKNQEGQ